MTDTVLFPNVDLMEVGIGFWIAFAVAAVGAWPIWKLLLRMKSRQNVSQHLASHQGKQGTPTMGGIIIAVGVIAAYGYQAATRVDSGIDAAVSAHLPNLSLIALILFAGYTLIGFTDDYIAPKVFGKKRGLGWKQKILMQVFFALIAGLMLTGWTWNLSVGVSVFLILFYSNAYNISDGLDGLSSTLLLGLAAGFAALCWHSVIFSPVVLLATPLFAAAIPFLFLNAPPAKVFMGDVGSLPIGAVLGLIASVLILPPAVWPHGPIQGGMGDRYSVETGLFGGAMNWPMLLPILILSIMMLIELVPVPLQVLGTKIAKRRYKPAPGEQTAPDLRLFKFKTPVHHAFEDAGWPETRVTACFALTQLVLSLAALSVYLATTNPRTVLGR
jgi:phospho-N-acetylmuramoyl-pentapeptide-transferase